LSDLELLERFKKIKEDPWEFCSKCVFTLDQADKKQPIKPFPAHYEYLKHYVRLWHKTNKLAVPKSRRMFISWVNISLFLWDSMFNIGRNNAMVSKKEDDADDLIKRAKFIYDHIPETMIPRDMLPKCDYTFGKLKFPELDSILQGFPQGADQLRQFTFSGIMGDEMAFWESAEAMYAASFPTLEGGGRFVGVSSPGPGFFKRLVFDKLEETGNTAATETIDRKAIFPMEGVEIWRNPKNKFYVFQLHYSANPVKKDPKYREEIKSAMPIRQYMQEYELQWDSFEGKAVYADWKKSLHASKKPLHPEFGLPLLRGWDFGLTPACVIAQLQGDQLVVLREFTEVNMGVERFSTKVLQHLRTLYPHWAASRDWIEFIDPSGNFRKDTTEDTCAGILRKVLGSGIQIVPGPVQWEPRRMGVDAFLTRYTKDGPCFQIDQAQCPVLVRGFDGGYRYSDKAFDIEPNKVTPIKDEHSHPHDALQYIAAGLSKFTSKRRAARVPVPQYSFMKPEKTEDERTQESIDKAAKEQGISNGIG
jgi:hypothetical protein